MTTLRAYHGKASLKRETLAQMAKHRAADQLIQGQYWSKGKGCAVACLTHDENGGHHRYPTKWGIPETLAHLEDRIFEGLPEKEAQRWPERFLTAIPVGADLARVGPQFLVALIQRRRDALDAEGARLVGAAMDQVLVVLRRWAVTGTLDAEGITMAESAAGSARSAAWSAAWSARSAESAAWSAAESAAESARSAARSAESAAWSAAESARSAESAAESARSAAWSARSAESAAESARSAAEYRWMATTLCRLLRKAS